VQPELNSLSEEVISDRIFDWIVDSERNTPYLRGNGRNAFGKWRGELVVGEGWRKLQEFGLAKGFVYCLYSSSLYSCSLSWTDDFHLLCYRMVAKGYDTTYQQFARVIQFLR
jgi:hypothetical protein